MIWERWEELSARLAEALESPDPEAHVSSSGDPELVALLRWHRRAGNFLQAGPPQPIPLRELPTRRVIRGRYELESLLGRGGAGVVFRGADRQVAGRPVVVKLLHDFWSSEDWMRGRFRQEAEIIARLDHPGIVSLIDAGETEDGRLFLVLPFHEGRTLREALTRGPLETPSAARLLQEIGQAVHHAHSQGILHRDLKPENILLVRRPDGEHAMLIDFGIAHIGDPAAPTQTTTHLMGSVAYMAPEHLMGKAVAASDTYSLGVIAWEMLTGTRPFESQSPFGLPELQRRGTGDAFFRMRPDLGVRVAKLLARALAFDAASRPAPVSAFTSELAAGLLAPAAGSRLERLWAVRRSRRWLLAGASVSVVGAAAEGWWLHDRWAPLSPEERTIDFPRGSSAEMAGFSVHRELAERAVREFPGGAVTAMRLFSPDQGQLHKRLSLRQKEWAFRRGWRIAALCRPESGYCGLALETGHFAPRFDCGLRPAPAGADLIATQRIRTGWDGIRTRVILPPAPHLVRLEMVYDPGKRTAQISLNGNVLIRGYAGHAEYRDDLGVFFGVGTFDGSLASTLFGGLRFEIFS